VGRLFGTDGVRGTANVELTPEIAYQLGRAGAFYLTELEGAGRRPGRRRAPRRRAQILMGRDTRISGDMLQAALVAGICSVGADVLLAGVMTTPGVAYLTRALEADAGVVISASHNPVEDNGIKFFSRDGFKLPDPVEDGIAQLVVRRQDDLPRPSGPHVGRVIPVADAVERYVSYSARTVKVSLRGLRVVVDCANGAASEVAPRVLGDLGATVIPLFNQPNGININVGCGSTNPEAMQQAVIEHRAHVGLAHDGDADRVLAADERGQLVDGDQILVICGLHRLRQGRLPNRMVVTTVLSNHGLELAFKRAGVKVLRTAVGDRYVLEEMLRSGATVGGEQSGHLIFLDHNTTGDGIITALQLLQVMVETGRSLSELAAQMPRLPQVQVNVSVRNKEGLDKNERIAVAIEQTREKLGHHGRVLVRPSGTEPVVRVMLEGDDEARLRAMARELAELIADELA